TSSPRRAKSADKMDGAIRKSFIPDLSSDEQNSKPICAQFYRSQWGDPLFRENSVRTMKQRYLIPAL
ncbi:hypothetical protein P5E67_28370, partial [Vibrio parahaemolyticus]|nr:hypothetical protein [Vibrio parahaemolyticus]